MTLLAGILIPIANVVVAKIALIKPSPKRISTISLTIGSIPA